MDNTEAMVAQTATVVCPVLEEVPQLAGLDLQTGLKPDCAEEFAQSPPVGLPEQALRQRPADVGVRSRSCGACAKFSVKVLVEPSVQVRPEEPELIEARRHPAKAWPRKK